MMFYEECKFWDGWHYRTTPEGHWIKGRLDAPSAAPAITPAGNGGVFSQMSIGADPVFPSAGLPARKENPFPDMAIDTPQDDHDWTEYGYFAGWNACLDTIAALAPAAGEGQRVEYTECNRDCDCVGYCKAGLEQPKPANPPATINSSEIDSKLIVVAWTDGKSAWLTHLAPDGAVIERVAAAIYAAQSRELNWQYASPHHREEATKLASAALLAAQEARPWTMKPR